MCPSYKTMSPPRRPGMMNEIRNAALIATVGDNPDVPLIQDNVPTAPFGDFIGIVYQVLRMSIEKDLEIGRAAEIDRRIRNLDRIGLWTPRNIGRDECLKVGDDPDVPLIQHDVPAAPFGDFIGIVYQVLRMSIEKDLEIVRAAEIDRRIRNLERIGL